MSLSSLSTTNTFKIELADSRLGAFRGDSIYEPGDEIQGHVILQSNSEFSCLGIEVFLEGTATVNYVSPTKVPLSKKKKLPLEWTRTFLLGNGETTQRLIISPGRYSYPFRILLKKFNPFPGTFESAHGKLEFHVVSEILQNPNENGCQTNKPILIRSYLNLLALSQTKKPITVSYPLAPSAFVKTPEEGELKFFFSLNKTGFLPGELIPFKLRLSNPQEQRVEKLFVSLNKKTSFTNDVSVRTSTVILDVKLTMNPAMINFEQAGWSATLTVPPDSYPSTTGIIIQHSYFIRVEVSASGEVDPAYIRKLMARDAPIIRDQPNSQLKKDIPIIVGTEMSEVEFESPFLGREVNLLRERSMSIASIASCGSMSSQASGVSVASSLPPRYSQLSSRAGSLTSLNSLPPSYEESVGLVAGLAPPFL